MSLKPPARDVSEAFFHSARKPLSCAACEMYVRRTSRLRKPRVTITQAVRAAHVSRLCMSYKQCGGTGEGVA